MTSSTDDGPDIVPVEYPDEMLTIAREFGLPSYIHVFMSYPERLDADRLARAVRLLVDAEPVLGCRFELTRKGPVWRRHPDLDAVTWFDHATAPDFDTAVANTLITEEQPNERNIVVRLFSLPGHDVVAVSINHAAGDGQGTLESTYHLASFYSMLRDLPAFRPVPNMAARDGFAWQQGLTWRDKLRTLKRDIGDARRAGRNPTGIRHQHDLDTWRAAPRTSPGFVDRWVEPADMDAVRRLASHHATSVFAILVSATARAFVDFADADPNRPFHVQTATDLRRFAPTPERPPVRNMATLASMTFHPARQHGFAVTLENTKQEVERLRAGMRGAMNPIAVSVLRRLSYATKRRLTEKAFRGKFRNAIPPTFSYVGRVREDMVRLDTTSPDRVLMIGGCLPMPVLLVLGLEYRGGLSLSIGFQKDDIAADKLRRFVDDIVDHIPLD